jgi:multiple sugar transport system substrate-binding protein
LLIEILIGGKVEVRRRDHAAAHEQVRSGPPEPEAKIGKQTATGRKMMLKTGQGFGVTRRGLLRAGASGLVLTSALGIAPRFLTRPAHAADLAPGMTGGPTGFPGCERYQYNESMSEGRAIEGIKKLKAAGKAPDKLVWLMGDGAINQVVKPYPPTGPSVQEVWERETGIKIQFVGVSPEENYPRVMQDITTKSGAYDIYTSFINEIGDLVESNGIIELDAYVDKYKPDWLDPVRGAPTKEIYNLEYTYNKKVYVVSLDGDFQVWVYRRDLFEDPQNKKEYEDKFKMPLRQPPTWTEVDQISQFFKGKGLNGHVNLLSPFWGTSTWFNRFVSYDNPDLYPFDLNGKPLINSDLGIKAAEAHCKSKEWSSKDILTWTYAEGYGSMGDGTGVMMCTYSNLPKFMDRKNPDGTPATKASGKFNSFIPPGTLHGNDLVRRSSLYLNTSATVSAQSKYPEAAYLLLQWMSSTRVFTWMSANPGGYFDPWQLANLSDPMVSETYHPYQVAAIKETIPRSAPTLNVPGARAMYDALDKGLLGVMTGSKSAKDAMNDAAAEWTKIIKKKGEKKMIDQINALRSAFPTIVDKMPT